MKKNYPGLDINFRIDLIEAETLSRQHSMLLTINSQLFRLFYALGKALNHEPFIGENDALKRISTEFTPKYGDYFSMPNLERMKEFAAKCPESIVQEMGWNVSWKYMPILFSLETYNEWQYYSSLVRRDCLDVNDLERIIKENRVIPEGKPEIFMPMFSLLEWINRQWITNLEWLNKQRDLLDLQLFFRSDADKEFKKLFSVKDRTHIIEADDQMGLSPIHSLIANFKSGTHYTISSMSKGSQINIGSQIASATSALGEESLTQILNQLVDRFNHKISIDFLERCIELYNLEQRPIDEYLSTITQKTQQKGNKRTITTFIAKNPVPDRIYDIYSEKDTMVLLTLA